MVLKADQLRMKALLKETITLLCKNGLNYKSEFSVEALIGITLDKGDVFLVNINERITDGLGGQVESSEADTCADVASPISAGGMDTTGDERSHSSSRRRRRRSRQGSPSASDTQYTNTPIEDTSNDRSFKVEDSDQFSSCQYENETSTTDRSNKRTNPDDQEDDSRVDFSSKRARSDDGSNGSDDVVFVKDEPFSDSELEQVSLGIAQHAQSQAMQELSYMPGSSQLGVPSGRTEPLPGCSNWTGQNPDVSVSSEMGSQLADPSSANSSIQMPGDASRRAEGYGSTRMETVFPGRPEPYPFSPRKEHMRFRYNITPRGLPRPVGLTSSPGSQRFANTLGDMRFQRPSPQSEYVCSTCKKNFTSRNGLKTHENLHKGIYPYKCPHCGKGFTCTSNLKFHVRKHDSETQFVCEKCQKGFVKKRDLINHIAQYHRGLGLDMPKYLGDVPRMIDVDETGDLSNTSNTSQIDDNSQTTDNAQLIMDSPRTDYSPKTDQSQLSDSAHASDLTQASDLAQASDFAHVSDLGQPSDLTQSGNLTQAGDFVPADDIAPAGDLTPTVDLASTGDFTEASDFAEASDVSEIEGLAQHSANDDPQTTNLVEVNDTTNLSLTSSYPVNNILPQTVDSESDFLQASDWNDPPTMNDS